MNDLTPITFYLDEKTYMQVKLFSGKNGETLENGIRKLAWLGIQRHLLEENAE